jgi:uncharacterized repeat protein (TIGR02543 family)
MKKLMKRLSFIAIILSILLVDFSFIQVKALTGINQLSVTTKLTQWTLDEAANTLYAISEEGNCLLFINANTLTIDKKLSLEGSPTDIIKDNGKLYIALDSINKIVVVNTTTKTVVDTLITTSDPYRIVKDGNSLYYVEKDQWSDTYQYDLNTRKDNILPIESLFNPDLAINVNNHILYIGESGSSRSDMIYYSTTEKKVLGQTNYNNGDGFSYPDRNTLYDGQYVYYAGYKFDPLSPTKILGSYASKNILLVKQGYVCAKTAIYNKTTGQVVRNYPNDIDLYEVSSQPMIYLYSAQEQKIVKQDPSKVLVTFNSQGGSLVPSIYANKNALLTSPAAPKKTGYTFGGWYKEASCINPWNFALDKVTGDGTLYGKWVMNVPTPASVKAISSSYSSIKVSWAAVTGASGYQVYRATSSTGAYSLITTTASISYNNIGLTYNAAYYYKIRAYKLVGTTKVYSNFSTVVSAKPVLSTPTTVRAVSSWHNSINTSWSAVTGASGYQVYRATSSTGTYSLIKTTTSTSYNNTGLTYNTAYYYKIRAYKFLGSTKVYSNFSAVVSAKPLSSTPTAVRAVSSSYSSIKTSWSSVAGASGYQVYRATSSRGTYSLIKTTTSISYNNTGLTTNKTYYYKVRAYKLVGTTKSYGNFSTVVSAKPVPSAPTTVQAVPSSYNIVKTSWSAVTGASGYQVYRATSSTGTYSLIKTTTSTSYNNTGLATNKTYYYKVRAYRLVGTTKIYGNFSKVVSARPVLSVPSNLGLQETNNSDLLISWNAVSGASGYTIYRATSTSGPYYEIKNTTASNYTVRAVDLQLGRTYYFIIKAYRYVGTQKVYSGSSRMVYVQFYLE